MLMQCQQPAGGGCSSGPLVVCLTRFLLSGLQAQTQQPEWSLVGGVVVGLDLKADDVRIARVGCPIAVHPLRGRCPTEHFAEVPARAIEEMLPAPVAPHDAFEQGGVR